MSQQLTLSSLLSALALASLCLAASYGQLGDRNIASVPSVSIGVQAEVAPGLHG